MRLTRRDAFAALAGLGAVSGGAVLAGQRLAGEDDPGGAEGAEGGGEATTVDDGTVGTLTAAAEVLYPSSVEGHREFVETYTVGRVQDRPAYREGLTAAAALLDDRAERWYGAPFPDLDRETRDAVLRELGADTADPVPDGTDAERVRFYVVDELLYAFYTSPTGGELAGTENPVGYPGGIESYQGP